MALSTGVVSGSIMRVYIGAYTAETPIAYATDSSIEFSAGEISISHKDVVNKWKSMTPGELSASVSTNALYAEAEVASGETFDLIWDAFLAGTNVYLKFSTELDGEEEPTILTGDVYYYGAFLCTSISLNAANNESVTYSASFTSDGAISIGEVGVDDTGA